MMNEPLIDHKNIERDEHSEAARRACQGLTTAELEALGEGGVKIIVTAVRQYQRAKDWIAADSYDGIDPCGPVRELLETASSSMKWILADLDAAKPSEAAGQGGEDAPE